MMLKYSLLLCIATLISSGHSKSLHQRFSRQAWSGFECSSYPPGSALYECAPRRCVLAEKRCDGVRDCVNGHDENGCPLPTELTTTDPLWSCQLEENTFRCSESGPCIPSDWVCDGISDCDTGKDEQNCNAASTTFTINPTDPSTVDSTVSVSDSTTIDPLWSCQLEENTFRCSEFGPCVPSDWVCDGITDCDTGKDEEHCNVASTDSPTAVSTEASSSAAPTGASTDEPTTTEASSSAAPREASTVEPTTIDSLWSCQLEENTFKCSESGPCVPSDWVCDGISDCDTGKDEQNCNAASTISYHTEPSTAASTIVSTEATVKADYTTTVDPLWSCQLEENTFRCSESGPCVPSDWVCDGITDCDTGKDEEHCNAASTASPTEASTAVSTEAPSSAAPTIDPLWSCQLEENTFRCSDSGPCVPSDWVCDGISDCDTGKDEEYCQSSVPTTRPRSSRPRTRRTRTRRTRTRRTRTRRTRTRRTRTRRTRTRRTRTRRTRTRRGRTH